MPTWSQAIGCAALFFPGCKSHIAALLEWRIERLDIEQVILFGESCRRAYGQAFGSERRWCQAVGVTAGECCLIRDLGRRGRSGNDSGCHSVARAIGRTVVPGEGGEGPSGERGAFLMGQSVFDIPGSLSRSEWAVWYLVRAVLRRAGSEEHGARLRLLFLRLYGHFLSVTTGLVLIWFWELKLPLLNVLVPAELRFRLKLVAS